MEFKILDHNEEQGMFDNFCVTDSIKSIANGDIITEHQINNIYKIYHSLINSKNISSERKAKAFYNLLFDDDNCNYSKKNITLRVVRNDKLSEKTQLIYFNKKKYYNVIGRSHKTFEPDIKIVGNSCVSRINTFLTIVKNDFGIYKLMIIDVSSLCGTYDDKFKRIKIKAYNLNEPVTIFIGNYMTSLTIS